MKVELGNSDEKTRGFLNLPLRNRVRDIVHSTPNSAWQPQPGSYLQGLFAVQGQGSQAVPLVTDLLTASVHAGRIVIVQLAGKHKEQKRDVYNHRFFSPFSYFLWSHAVSLWQNESSSSFYPVIIPLCLCCARLRDPLNTATSLELIWYLVHMSRLM